MNGLDEAEAAQAAAPATVPYKGKRGRRGGGRATELIAQRKQHPDYIAEETAKRIARRVEKEAKTARSLHILNLPRECSGELFRRLVAAAAVAESHEAAQAAVEAVALDSASSGMEDGDESVAGEREVKRARQDPDAGEPASSTSSTSAAVVGFSWPVDSIGSFKGRSLVELSSKALADRVMATLHSVLLRGRRIVVERAQAVPFHHLPSTVANYVYSTPHKFRLPAAVEERLTKIVKEGWNGKSYEGKNLSVVENAYRLQHGGEEKKRLDFAEWGFGSFRQAVMSVDALDVQKTDHGAGRDGLAWGAWVRKHFPV